MAFIEEPPLARGGAERGRAGRLGWLWYAVDTGELSASATVHELLGEPRGSRLDPAALLHRLEPSSRALVLSWLEALRAGGEPVEGRLELRSPDGALRTVRIAGRGEHRGGHLVALHGVVEDLTVRLAEERTARWREVMLDEAERLAALGSWSHDFSTGISTWSDNLYRVYGIPPGTVMALEDVMALVTPEQRDTLAALVRRAEEEQVPYELDLTMHRVDGTPRIIHVTSRVVTGPDGSTVGMMGMAQDVTEERRRAEARLRLDRLESLGQLAAGLAHDLNNFLTSSALGLSMVLDRPPAPEDREPLSDALLGVDAARGAVNRLMTFARGSAPRREAITVTDFVAGVAQFTLRGTATTLQLTAEGPQPTLWADRGQLEQLVSNLVLNASQAMGGKGEVHLTLGPHPPGEVRLEVSDVGPGIDPRVKDSLFEPYVTTKPAGTGLGLATCKAVVLHHGGTIEVSPSSRGACFVVRLPAGEPEPLVREPPPAAWRSLAGKVVAVLDDDPGIRRVLSSALSSLHVTAHVAATEAQLWAVLEAHRADMVVLDMTVPGSRGGRELVGEVRARYPAARAVLSSGYAVDGVADWRALGFSAVLPKPYDRQRLATALLQALDGDSATVA